MQTRTGQASRMPLGLKVVASYFLLSFAMDLSLALLVPGPQYTELAGRSTAGKLGSATRQVIFMGLYLATGIGLFRRRAWARKLGLFLLPVVTFYGAHAFAWGFAGGRPSHVVLLMSFVVEGAWYAIWFYLLYRFPDPSTLDDASVGELLLTEEADTRHDQ